MHIAHLITSLGIGGTERQLLELLRGLDRERWQPLVVCLRKTGAFLSDLRSLHIDPEHIDLHGTLLRPHTLGVVRRLASWLTRRRVGLVHCHDIYGIFLGVPAARLAGLPVLASRRDLGHHLSPLQRPILRMCVRHATRVLTNAASVAALVEREDGIPPARMAIVPNGLDLERFSERARMAASPPPPFLGRVPTVLTVARMTYPAKGHDDLIEAAVQVHAHRPDVRFVIAGDGPREPYLRQLAARLGVAEVVAFAGRRNDVPALLASADIYCHPARAEGLPNAVLEAMAARRPIVATEAGGTPELVHDRVHGLVVRREDPPALAEAILELLGDPALAGRLASAARARVEEEFTAKRLAERVDRLYGELTRDT